MTPAGGVTAGRLLDSRPEAFGLDELDETDIEDVPDSGAAR